MIMIFLQLKDDHQADFFADDEERGGGVGVAVPTAGGRGVGGEEGEIKLWMMSMGTGKMMVEFFSAEMELRV